MNLETRRQIFHALFGILIVLSLYFDILGLTFFAIFFLLAVLLSYIYKKRKIRIIKLFLDKFEREGAFPGQGMITFILSTLLCLLLFDKNVALASLMILALGDSFTHLGKFGRIKHPFNEKKYLEGVILGILAGGVGASFFVNPLTAFLGSFFAMIFESFDIVVFDRRLDDNITVPLVAGVVMSL